VRTLLVQHAELVGRPDRQLAQQHLVDQREDRRVGANPGRERQNRHAGEEGVAAEATQGVYRIEGRGGRIFVIEAASLDEATEIAQSCQT
jgi:hypothetical protein